MCVQATEVQWQQSLEPQLASLTLDVWNKMWNKSNEGRRNRQGGKSTKCQTPFYGLQDNSILYVSRLLLTISTQHLKWNYTKTKLKIKFQLLLVHSPTVLLRLLCFLWYHNLGQDKKLLYFSGRSLLEWIHKAFCFSSTYASFTSPLKSFLH